MELTRSLPVSTTITPRTQTTRGAMNIKETINSYLWSNFKYATFR